MMSIARIFSRLAVIVLFAPVLAEADSGFYVGASAGGATISTSPEIPSVPLSFEEDDTAFKILGGYRLDLPLVFAAVEGAYVDFGSPEMLVLDDQLRFDTTGISVFGIAGLEVGPFELFGKLGGIAWDLDVSGFDRNYSDDGFDFGVGAGIALGLGPLSIRGEYEYFDVGRGDISMLSVGATYLFD
jgi:hypothetical protein